MVQIYCVSLLLLLTLMYSLLHVRKFIDLYCFACYVLWGFLLAITVLRNDVKYRKAVSLTRFYSLWIFLFPNVNMWEITVQSNLYLFICQIEIKKSINQCVWRIACFERKYENNFEVDLNNECTPCKVKYPWRSHIEEVILLQKC